MRGVDPDGDRLTFGVSGPDAELVKLEQQGDNQVGGWWGGKWSKMIKIIFNQADLFLAQSLDHEAAAEHQVTEHLIWWWQWWGGDHDHDHDEEGDEADEDYFDGGCWRR